MVSPTLLLTTYETVVAETPANFPTSAIVGRRVTGSRPPGMG